MYICTMSANTAEVIWGHVCVDLKLSIELSFCKDIQKNRKWACPQQQAQAGKSRYSGHISAETKRTLARSNEE